MKHLYVSVRDFLIESMDSLLLWGLSILSCISLCLLYSAAPEFFFQGTRNLLIGIVVMYIVSQFSPQVYMQFAPVIFVLSLLGLLFVFFLGDVSRGAKRWVHLGGLRVQPSELMKIAMPLILSWYFQKIEKQKKLYHFLGAFLLLLIPVWFILKQPDLGTAIVVFGVGSVVIFLAGLPLYFLLIGLFCVLLASPFLCQVPFPSLLSHPLLHTYQCHRLTAFLNPTSDPLGTGYHTIQSMIAIGSGGYFGKGWLHGTQTHLDFVPERHTDFIFATLTEEFGFLGSLLLISLYIIIVLRGCLISFRASDPFSRLLGAGLIFIFFIYMFLNISMVSGMLPVVGVPLPLISYGGSAMVTVFIMFGMLMSIHKHRSLVQT